MIEMLGVGVPDGEGGWWLHRVCARLPAGQLLAVVASRLEERQAFLDSVSGQVIPLEGRVWVRGVPVMPESLGRIRMLVGDVRPGPPTAPGRTILSNALAAASALRGALAGVLRFPRRMERQAARQALEALGLGARLGDTVATLDPASCLRLAIARAMAARSEVLVLRDPDVHLGPGDTGAILERLRALAGSWPISMLVSLTSVALACEYADRLVVLSEGSLIYEGPPGGLRDARERRLGAFILAGR